MNSPEDSESRLSRIIDAANRGSPAMMLDVEKRAGDGR